MKMQILSSSNNRQQTARKPCIDSTSLSDSKGADPSTSISLDELSAVSSAFPNNTSRITEVRAGTPFYPCVNLLLHKAAYLFHFILFYVGNVITRGKLYQQRHPSVASSALVELTTRLDFFKERRSQLMEQLHNLDSSYGASAQGLMFKASPPWTTTSPR